MDPELARDGADAPVLAIVEPQDLRLDLVGLRHARPPARSLRRVRPGREPRAPNRSQRAEPNQRAAPPAVRAGDAFAVPGWRACRCLP